MEMSSEALPVSCPIHVARNAITSIARVAYVIRDLDLLLLLAWQISLFFVDFDHLKPPSGLWRHSPARIASAMVKCPNCGGRVDLTKEGDWGHCADCTELDHDEEAILLTTTQATM